jgi:hypothetical protein
MLVIQNDTWRTEMNKRQKALVKLGHSLGKRWTEETATKGELVRLQGLFRERDADFVFGWDSWFAYEGDACTVGERLLVCYIPCKVATQKPLQCSGIAWAMKRTQWTVTLCKPLLKGRLAGRKRKRSNWQALDKTLGQSPSPPEPLIRAGYSFKHTFRH